MTERVWVPSRYRFKAIVIAAPKTGKTGAIAALINAGYRVILAAFDPGYDILLNLVEPEQMHNLIILPFADKRGFKGKDSKITVGHMNNPVAFAKFAEFLNTGRARQARCQGGEIIELGASETWGTDTFLVVDNLTTLSKDAWARWLNVSGRDTLRWNKRDWMISQAEVDNVLIQLAADEYNYNLIVLAHWDVKGPREYEDEDKKNPEKSDYNNELREREKDLIPTKQVPVSIGRALSKTLTQHFPTCVWAEVNDSGQRIFNLEPKAVRDSGVPVRAGTLPKTLPIETGLLTIFEAVTGKSA